MCKMYTRKKIVPNLLFCSSGILLFMIIVHLRVLIIIIISVNVALVDTKDASLIST